MANNQPENYKASIIIAFYNNIEALKLVFKALEKQTENNFEVIIADDGSKSEIVKELNTLSEQSTLTIQHLWQEDIGFRKNRCLNKAVQASRSNYLIFIDGDCIPQCYFIEDHLSEAEQGVCLNGRRADLSHKMSQLLRECDNPACFISQHRTKLLFDYLFGNGKNIEKGFRITNTPLRKAIQKKNKGLVGCNFSLFKQDLFNINGFDQRYEAPGIGEDSDIDFRLGIAGIMIKPLFYKANQVHLQHKELPRSDVNSALFKKIRKEKKAWTNFGIVQNK
ncbi:glycosyl transferase, family 2 [Psychromonas ingrahamii 37]|uniref:Glycosyl transferase, family 2 n=1 Tax=Psychromonas ingrahamii (strain DSM 17664 / CCUG 51855 / 37) TaxID=357804 RepID=A1SRT2_PSYIN|nr:glycosyltransferase [Psychromonas ingrahamii]ABM02197.1 glycosyl transferase, family 2 [Psychromonas ingrahamii 37]